MAKKKSYPPELKASVLQAMRDHMVAVGGSRNWGDFYKQYPDIPNGTLRQWVEEVRRDPPPEMLLRKARARIQDTLEGATVLTEVRSTGDATANEIAKVIPAAPPPAIVSKDIERSRRQMDFLLEIGNLLDDADALRAYAIENREDLPRGFKIKNPIVFDRAMQRRASIIGLGIDAHRTLWDLETMQQFYSSIVETIRSVSPEMAREVLTKLRELNNRTGMTISFGQ